MLFFEHINASFIFKIQDVIPYLDSVVNEIYTEKYNRQLPSPIELRPFNAEKTRNMRNLDPTGKNYISLSLALK